MLELFHCWGIDIDFCRVSPWFEGTVETLKRDKASLEKDKTDLSEKNRRLTALNSQEQQKVKKLEKELGAAEGRARQDAVDAPGLLR